ncbi:hypothetical protein LX36DRAFT_663160 [Colletotrichum falcatum]|nr:hypothetical protein LX36DRAFT_663160 [Colletotrichum falcatum]
MHSPGMRIFALISSVFTDPNTTYTAVDLEDYMPELRRFGFYLRGTVAPLDIQDFAPGEPIAEEMTTRWGVGGGYFVKQDGNLPSVNRRFVATK